MTKRIIAIVAIFILTTIAWAILGGTILARTYDSGQVSSSRVESTWGTEHNQGTPTALFKTHTQRATEVVENGLRVTRYVTDEAVTPLPLESSKIDVTSTWATGKKACSGTALTKLTFWAITRFAIPAC